MSDFADRIEAHRLTAIFSDERAMRRSALLMRRKAYQQASRVFIAGGSAEDFIDAAAKYVSALETVLGDALQREIDSR